MDPNIIADKACQQFANLPKKGKPIPTSEWTTMAAIIEEICDVSNDLSSFKVVSLGTGTKCLGRKELSKLGQIVSDSHAEVIARRSFLLYLYEQIELCAVDKMQNSIFEYVNQDECKVLGNLKLRKNVKFHMFISHLPCGDAAIIESSERIEIEKTAWSSPPTKKSKLEEEATPVEHRTGAKLQVGPLNYEDMQKTGQCRVKPGKGDPTLSMSCSDKLAKWQIMGLQGALLSLFIHEPITLKSITIGGSIPYNKVSLERALFHRISESITEKAKLPKEYSQSYHCPVLQQSERNFMEFTEKLVPAPASISWHSSSKVLDSNETVQVLVGGRKQGATKKNFGKPSSMVEICRANILSRLKSLYSSQLENSEMHNDVVIKSYSNCKNLSRTYVEAWNILKNEVFIGWTEKPDELQAFV